MTQDNNSKKGFKKLCKNGCGKQIQWDIGLNAFTEVDSGDKHRCPNFVRKPGLRPQSMQSVITHTHRIDTSEELLAEIYKTVKNLELLLNKDGKGN
jgi:hypothetical protein